jgi:hypothetical protein
MRSFALALLIVAISASPASAAVIELEDQSSPEDNDPNIAILVRAAPGETNHMTVSRVTGGVLIQDSGAPLTGECTPTAGGRFCEGEFFGVVDVFLGDGDDSLRHDGYGQVDAGPGDDDVVVTNGFIGFSGGPGADRLDASAAISASISYADHTAGVSVRLNGLADDGAPGEGDNVIGPIDGIVGGQGDDYLEAGDRGASLLGGAGDDVLVGSPQRDHLTGGAGDDRLLAGGGSDSLVGNEGADVLRGGDGPDEVTNGGFPGVRMSIGDGPNDGLPGEGDDIRGDVESLVGGSGDDVLIGDDDPNRLAGYEGHDVLRGRGGGDQIWGWGDGDELDGGAGRDSVTTRPRRLGGLDRALLRDDEVDSLECDGAAPFIEADAQDELDRCAPAVVVHRRGRLRAHRRATLFVRCPASTAVPCRGRLWLHLAGTRRKPLSGRKLTRVIRFGPIREGHRKRIRILIRGRVPRHGCVYASSVTRRHDGNATRTVTSNVLRCLPD